MLENHEVNASRLKWDLRRRTDHKFDKYWQERHQQLIPLQIFSQEKPVWLEVGAGTGWFFIEMAKWHPNHFFVAIERSRHRGKRLVEKSQSCGLPNVLGYRSNAIPALIHGIPSESLERIYLLYPPPWPRNAQRKNRWFLHPIMPHLVRLLKKQGLLIWASDQKFYIDEARYVSESLYPLKTLVHGEIAPNPFNGLELFPNGRTKFERTFLAQGQPCYELISQKSSDTLS